MNVLDGLDDIPWASLKHAYGSADDVPDGLRAIAAGGDDEETLQELFSSVTHQGTVYSATSATVQFFLRMPNHPTRPARSPVCSDDVA